MHPKPVALPRPPRAETIASAASPENQLKALLGRRQLLALELGQVDAEIERVGVESICGLTDDTQDVETYDGLLGVSRAFVDQHERAVGQLQWLADLPIRFIGPNESPGNVNNVRWGSGGLFADNLFITAGHCFDQYGGGWQRPSRNGFVVEPEEIARLMKVNFNYQVNGITGQTRSGVSFPVEELLEFRRSNLDYAIIRLGRNEVGQLPGEIFDTLRIAPQDIVANGAMLCLIQHPAGRPKRIEAGPMLHNTAGQIAYDSLDTLGGSSGSPILSLAGEIVGVHTNGGCSTFNGFNFGLAIGAIRATSSIVQ